MNKEKILAKSRKENGLNDEREINGWNLKEQTFQLPYSYVCGDRKSVV